MAASHSGRAAGPTRPYPAGRIVRAGNTIVGVLIRAGLIPRGHLLTTRGRKSGRLRTQPVALVEHEGRRWLVAPYGAVSWVLNARAAGKVILRRRFTARAYTIRELAPMEAGPVLKRYVGFSAPARPYFQATRDSPVEDFIAEAGRHPVFELTPLDGDPWSAVSQAA
ncbi:nitroreductase family deazaflavin-dependent oxidoreductase [Nonomuraea sp. B1E8]|uniref:nitroreductase family deazaflavin-dependent oxidoreductase n=1 Tax=unclassified Nonomuraea TaxID=2593643 RepID=UPI00325E1D7C